MVAFCELSESGDRIEIHFAYNAQKKDAVRKIPGAKAVPPDKSHTGNWFWTVPLEMRAAQTLRTIFGPELKLGNAVRAWGREENQRLRNLSTLTTADDAVLERLPKVAPLIARVIDGEPIPEFGLPKRHPLSKKRPARPYQRADIKMMAMTNVINANQPGIGKTLEAIAAAVEAGLEAGPHLVCAPRRSLENVWKVEIERLLGHPVYTSENATERRKQLELGLKLAAKSQACWIGTIHNDLRLKKVATDKDSPEKRNAAAQSPLYARKDHNGCVYHFASELQRQLMTIMWNTFNVDEFHLAGLNNPMSLFTLGTDLVKAKRQWRMSGTPMGGKPLNLFPVLRSIEPKRFSSKWRWADEWLEVEVEEFRGRGGVIRTAKKIGGIRSGKEEEFYKAHSTVMVRRMKREALPGLPTKVIEVVACDMTPKQHKQYVKFADDAEVRIQGTEGSKLVVGTCILAEYERLKQFANGYCELNANGEVSPTEESGKLPYLLDKLDEQGIRKVDPEPRARAIIASQSSRMVEMVSRWLHKQGIENDMLTGKTKDSTPIIDRFHSEDQTPYVIVMTTKTGGVSLNLEEANSIHVLDESWNPDNEEQLEDRGDRGTRETPLVVYYYRTVGTVQEYIADVADGKKVTNRTALDVYRQIEKMKDKE